MPRAHGCAGADIARLPALVPKPRINLIRFHGVFAPNSKHRALVTPAKRGKGRKLKASDKAQDQAPAECRAAMTWAKRLKRVFNIDIEAFRMDCRWVCSTDDPKKTTGSIQDAGLCRWQGFALPGSENGAGRGEKRASFQ